MITRFIDRHHASMRLDRYLRKTFPNEPLSTLFSILRKKKVRVNGIVAKAPQIVREGDLIAIYENLKSETAEDQTQNIPVKKGWGTQKQICDPVFFNENFDIQLETEDFLIVRKPAGLASQPGTHTRDGETLVDLLRQWGENQKLDFKPTLVHRLDRETSGLLIAALHGDVLRKLAQMIREHQIGKHYYALVKGNLKKTKGTIRSALERSDKPQGKKVESSESGKMSVTHYQVYKRYEGFDLLKIRLETGRMHQIRVHFSELGHPLAGDTRYGDFALNREMKKDYGLKRLFLHSYRLEFLWKGKTIVQEATLPDDLKSVLRKLDQV